jgi:hypothetical protein
LKKHLKDSDPKVRIVALRGMFQHQEKIELNILVNALGGPFAMPSLTMKMLIKYDALRLYTQYLHFPETDNT